MPTWLSVGAGVDGRDQADASLDELFISGVARVGNSQQTRLLVSQSSAHRVDVLDWLGNTLSQFGGLGSGAGQFSSPQALLSIGGVGGAGGAGGRRGWANHPGGRQRQRPHRGAAR
ncbi:hypothetical protein [Candidatus Amarobacter glycogenicus]|uniref:hypothetical protein n=1 Tax=Candidatus Amarobacter glycogenicus TaxID=3140699 RepID=UPI002A126742|nr:hypothetical protein [Dehalococcoidia bacterium]